MRDPRVDGLWLCADLALRDERALVTRVEAVLARPHARVSAIWVRAPRDAQASVLARLVTTLLPIAHANVALVLVGDRLDVALACDADGAHLGSRSLAPALTRRLLDRGAAQAFLSCAVHDRAEIDARAPFADALVLSPLYAVRDKSPPLHAGRFAALRASAPAVAFVALGGIDDEDRAHTAFLAGADAIAVRRAFLEPDDVAQAADRCARLLERVERVRERGRA